MRHGYGSALADPGGFGGGQGVGGQGLLALGHGSVRMVDTIDQQDGRTAVFVAHPGQRWLGNGEAGPEVCQARDAPARTSEFRAANRLASPWPYPAFKP